MPIIAASRLPTPPDRQAMPRAISTSTDVRVSAAGISRLRLAPGSAKETTVGLTIHSMAVDTLVPLLRTLSTLLDKGAEHMKAKGANPDALTEARLAPDMFPLTRQVQIACDQAKSAAARLTGQEPPKFEDTEQTLDQLKARIRRTLDYIEGVPAAAYQGAETRRVEFPLMNDLVLDMSGEQFLRD
jgi:hypothetical protein